MNGMSESFIAVLYLWAHLHTPDENRWYRFRIEMPPGTHGAFCGTMAPVGFPQWKTNNPGWEIEKWWCENERVERYTAWMYRPGR